MGCRRFLRQTGAAPGVALAVPSFIPASALGRGGAIAPSQKITMGFTGVGTQGSSHLLGVGGWHLI
jgi:hypothetical protein